MATTLSSQPPAEYGQVLAIYPRRRTYEQIPWYVPKVGITKKYAYVDDQPVPILDSIFGSNTKKSGPLGKARLQKTKPDVSEVKRRQRNKGADKENMNIDDVMKKERRRSGTLYHYGAESRDSTKPAEEPRAMTLPRRTSSSKAKMIIDDSFVSKSSSAADINAHGDSMLRLNGFTNISQENSPSHLYKSHSLKKYNQRRLSYTGSDVIDLSQYDIPSSVPKSPSKGPIRMRVWCNQVNDPDGAVFRKLLSSSKNNKHRAANFKFKGGDTQDVAPPLGEDEAEFEARKQDWQQELEQLSEFLLQKSTQEQQEEGSSSPTDTAFIIDSDGLPILRAVFDVTHFNPEEIRVKIEGSQLQIHAQHLDDRDDRVYTKTLIRKMDLPDHADPRNTYVNITKSGNLHIELPFHLPPQPKPVGPNVFRILEDAQGNRKIRLVVDIGAEFTCDDVTVEASGRKLLVVAGYDAELGKYGVEKQQRQFRRQYELPSHICVESSDSALSPDGRLFIELTLRHEPPIRCNVTTQELT